MLLREFVEKYGNGIEVIYSLSGWLKQSGPPSYHIRLVEKNRLAEAKQQFDGNCSIQVYSVQASLPKDPATLWNHEFVQAEDLYRHSLMADNCLLYNRFGGVLNSFVKRIDEKIQNKTPVVSGFSRSICARPTTLTPRPKQKSSPNTGVQFPDVAKAVKIEGQVIQDQEKVIELGEKVNNPKLPNNNEKFQRKKGSGAGAALAGMWGRARASTKPKPNAYSGNSDNLRQSSAEAQISAREAVEFGSSDDDGQDLHIKRTYNGEGSKKRRVVFDYSDEEDELQDAVNLDSPDPPKKSVQYTKDGSSSKGLEQKLTFDKECESKVNKLHQADESVNKPTIAKSKHDSAEPSASEKRPNHEPEMNTNIKHEVVDAQPKRRKVVKTRIDDRGREVSDIVWESEEPDTKSVANSVNTSEKSTANNAGNRPPAVKKSPAVGNTASSNKPGKDGNKKAGNKHPKQGNILSFFKKA